MSDQPSHNLDGLDIDMARQIDAVCRRFEADRREGRQPRVEDYLDDVPGEVRPALRAELVALERELGPPDDTVARPESGPAPAPEPQTALGPFAVAEAPTIAPGTPRIVPLPGAAPSSVHEESTLPPFDQPQSPHDLPTAAGLDQTAPVGSHAAEPVRIRYFGDYEIMSEIARGGMGVVFHARQMSLNRPVALKMILAGQLANETDVKRFYTEAEAAANLDHPGIVPIFEVGQHEGQHYFSMGFVEGQSLSQRLASGPLPPREAAALMAKVADAIEYAHQCGVIHRDLKPGNILLDQKGNPRVTDFGLARKIQGDSGLTGSGQIMGTPSYMPPEQAGGRRGEVGPAADVYALGATLYCAVTGRPPFQAATAMDTVIQVVSDEPVPPRRLNPAIPRDLETICLKCLEKEPGRRYASAAALAADLRRFLTGEPIAARPVTRLERLAKWARRKPTLAAAYTLGLLAVLLGGLGGTAVWQWRAAQRAQAEAERQREKFERSEYGRTIEVAHQEWRDNNVPAALALLESTRADLRGWEWRYVHRLCHSDLLTLKGHTGEVVWASFSPDGSRIVTGGNDKTVKVWDAKSGAELLTLKGHTPWVNWASFSPDGLRIVTSEYYAVKVWDAKSGAELLTLKGLDSPVFSASFSPDGERIVTARMDKTPKVWDAKSGAEVLTLKGHTDTVKSARFSPDGTRIVTGSDDKTAKVWDAKSGAELLTLKGHTSWVNSASFSPDGTRIVTGSFDLTVKVWDAKSGAEVLTLKGHTREVPRASFFTLKGHTATEVPRASFSPDGSRIVTVSDDQPPKVWDAKSGAILLTFKGHDGPVNSASFSPDGSRIVTANRDLTAKVWDAKSGAILLTLKGHTGPVDSASFSPDGSRIVTGSHDKTAKVWDAKSGAEFLTLKGHTAWIWSASFSPDGSRIVTGSGDRSGDLTAKVWDAKRGAEFLTLWGHIGPVTSASFSPDGSRIVTSGDYTAKVWDAKSGAVLLVLKRQTDMVVSASFSPDGSRIVTGSDDKTAKVWYAKSGAEVLTLKGHIGPVRSASFSPDGERIVTGSDDLTAKVWDARSGAEVLTLKGHTNRVNSASFSPDGSRIVTGSWDNTAKVWDARSGAEVLTLKGHTGPVYSASFSPDGERIVTASYDRTAKVWDARSGAEVLTLKGHTDTVNSVAFSPDGARIVTASWDQTAKVWDARPVNYTLPVRQGETKIDR